MGTSPVTVFLSYSRDSNDHIAWVTRLANALEERPEFHVVFDGYDLLPGGDLTHFMDKALRSDRVVVVITPSYVCKASDRRGGVGYESTVISGELLSNSLQDTFIPVLRAGTERPSFLQTKLYIDFRLDNDFDAAFGELTNAILRRPRVIRPAKRGQGDTTTDDMSGSGARLREYFAEVRAVLGTAIAALEDYADVVQGLLRSGRWSTVVAVAEPSQLTYAEANARRAVRIYNAKICDALASTRHVLLSAPLNPSDAALFAELVQVLRSLASAGARAELAVPKIRHGMTPQELFSEYTEMFVDLEGKLRPLLYNAR